MKTALATERGKNATCDTTHCRGKYRFLQFLSDIPAPHELQSEGGEVGKAKELRSWRPRSGSPGTLEGPRQARPFPGGSLHLTPGFLKSSSRTWSWHGPASRASQGPGAAKAACTRPQGRRGDGLSAQARSSEAPPDAVRLETVSLQPRAAVASASLRVSEEKGAPEVRAPGRSPGPAIVGRRE